MTMREKIARTLAMQTSWPGGDDVDWEPWLGHADAVLIALEEPTEGMVARPYGGEPTKSELVMGTWSAMIRAAKGGA